MSKTDVITGLERIILEESYVLGFRHPEDEIHVVMNFSLGVGNECIGVILFPEVKSEEWRTHGGEVTSLEGINRTAHRYYSSGPESPPDLGDLDSIKFVGGQWHLFGDWGTCRLRSESTPRVLFEDTIEGS